LAVNPTDRVLYAGTYGRSFFSYDVGSLASVRDFVPASSASIGRMLAPRPNPAKGATRIGWEISKRAPVRIEIYSVAGRLVWEAEVEASAGRGSITWDGVDTAGRDTAPGTYFVRVNAAGNSLGRETIVLLR
jgi:flagellar hook assembly protein FlgD